jgi:hypothetical protein
MKKNAVLVLVALSITALGLTLIPHVFSQPENVEILSYSWYMNPYDSSYLIVVGEAQNTGPNVINYITVAGTFYAPDGTVFMSNFNNAFITQILPQQKTPFYIAFSPANIVAGTNWTSQDVTNYTITVAYASPTDTRQYQDLTVLSDSAGNDADGYYCVTGTVKNTGSQASNRTWVVATFYNSTGGVVAVGYSSYLTPSSIPAGGTAAFTIYPTDYEAVVANIASYSLVIQTELTAPPPTSTPTPSLSPTASPTPTAPSSSPTPTPTASGNGTAIPDTYIYVAAIVVVIVVVGVVALALRKRAGKRTAISKEQAE